MRAAALALALVLLPACSADPGPDEESTGQGAGSGPVTVPLAGLPIGGRVAAFTSARPLRCVEVTLTGDELPSGVVATIRAFDVPPGFVAAGSACEGLDACLGGPGLTAGGTCSLPLRWDGQEEPTGTAELAVLAADLTCPSRDRCDEALAAVSATGPGTLDLEVRADG